LTPLEKQASSTAGEVIEEKPAALTPPISIASIHPNGSGAPRAKSKAKSKDLRIEMKDYERERILEALTSCAGNQTAAAKLLGVSRRMLVNRLNLYDIPRPRKGRIRQSK
jgi:two-component system response regulator AtoC